MKRRIKLTESALHRIIKESVKRIVNEGYGTIQGGSSAGPASDPTTGKTVRNQGGPLGYNKPDERANSEIADRNREAKNFQDSQKYYKKLCYKYYDDVMSMCPGYMNSGYYEKAAKYCGLC